LFADGSSVRHFAALSNIRDWEAVKLIRWHREKAGTIERIHDVMKNDLTAGALPSKYLGTNAACLRPAQEERGKRDAVGKEKTQTQLWRRGWDLNPLPLLDTRKLLILRYAQYAKNAQSASRRYTAGTRNTALLTLAERGPDSRSQKTS
jgi:hypothetical protein